MFFCPFLDSIVVAAYVLSIEIWESDRRLFVPPYLTENSNVNIAHKLLANDIETVSCTNLLAEPLNLKVVFKRLTNVKLESAFVITKLAFSKGVVIIEVVVK